MKYLIRIFSCFRTALSLTLSYLGAVLLLICFISIPHSYSQEVESDSTWQEQKPR